jgi:hypothetical protein
MRSIGMIAIAAALLAVSMTGSKDALGAPNVLRATLTPRGAFLLQIHGCHPYWDEGWSNALHRYLVHRHGRNCQPEAYRRSYDDRHWQRGQRDYDDGDWRRGKRNYDERDWRQGDEGNYDEGPPPRWRQPKYPY